MLYNSQDQVNEQKSFNPGAVNDLGPVKCTASQKVVYILLMIITLGIAYFFLNIKKLNKLNALQNKINESASNIEVQLEKRFSTLSKLVQAVESQAKLDKEVYENLAKFRSTPNNDLTEKSGCVDKIQTALNVAVENYPKLGVDQSVMRMMNESIMIEKEIAAARRLYNADVNQFNTSIYNFPTNVVVAKKGYQGLNLFKATEEHKKDVDISFNTSGK